MWRQGLGVSVEFPGSGRGPFELVARQVYYLPQTCDISNLIPSLNDQDKKAVETGSTIKYMFVALEFVKGRRDLINTK